MCWTTLANWCAHLKEKKENKANDDEDEGHLTDRGLKSIALFADSFSRYTRTQLYIRECGLPRAVSLVGVSRCDCSTIATLSCSHGLHPSGSSSPSLPRPSLSTWPPSLDLSLSLPLNLSLACLSHPSSLPLFYSHPLGFSLAIISPPPSRPATPGAPKCLFETHPSRRYFPANGIDAFGFCERIRRIAGCIDCIDCTDYTDCCLTRAADLPGRPEVRKARAWSADRPAHPILVEKSRRVASLCIARMRVFDAKGELRDITCCWHGKSPNVEYTTLRRGRDERAGRDREHLYRLNSVVLSHSY